MAYHVWVGEIEDNHIIEPTMDPFDHSFGESWCAHFRLEVIGGYLGGGNHDPLLQRVGAFFSAVKEVGDVRILFRLGESSLG